MGVGSHSMADSDSEGLWRHEILHFNKLPGNVNPPCWGPVFENQNSRIKLPLTSFEAQSSLF